MTSAKVERLRKVAEEARKYARTMADVASAAEDRYRLAENALYAAQEKRLKALHESSDKGRTNA
jgi:F0F1-type ATP synthase gamma subunit